MKTLKNVSFETMPIISALKSVFECVIENIYTKIFSQKGCPERLEATDVFRCQKMCTSGRKISGNNLFIGSSVTNITKILFLAKTEST